MNDYSKLIDNTSYANGSCVRQGSIDLEFGSDADALGPVGEKWDPGFPGEVTAECIEVKKGTLPRYNAPHDLI